MELLGQLYEDGHGVAKDHEQAMSWFRKAVAAGDATAAKRLKK
jgi:TPR repeat protein